MKKEKINKKLVLLNKLVELNNNMFNFTCNDRHTIYVNFLIHYVKDLKKQEITSNEMLQLIDTNFDRLEKISANLQYLALVKMLELEYLKYIKNLF